MSEVIDIRGAAGAVQAMRQPLRTALDAATASLACQGLPRDKAAAWAAAELLAVVAEALNADLPRDADGEALGEMEPFDMADTGRHQQIERDMAAAAERLAATGLAQTTAATAAAALVLESVAGILAGMARFTLHPQD